jgi:hypothetical protein
MPKKNLKVDAEEYRTESGVLEDMPPEFRPNWSGCTEQDQPATYI